MRCEVYGYWKENLVEIGRGLVRLAFSKPPKPEVRYLTRPHLPLSDGSRETPSEVRGASPCVWGRFETFPRRDSIVYCSIGLVSPFFDVPTSYRVVRCLVSPVYFSFLSKRMLL